ncbi:MAG: protein kinase [Bradymonadaceae bacterium]
MGRMPEVGETVDGVFRIDEELDHGNFGAIFRVRDLSEQRTLALKVLKPGPHDEEEVRKRFEREARLVYGLDHRHVVEVHYFGETGSGLPYMAMEFLEGTDLKRLLRAGHRLSVDQIRRIAVETLSALSAAHERGILHRDLKPGNVFLVDDGDTGFVKVLDFGFAKSIDDQSGEDLTKAKTVVGSPAYMAPELVHKENVGPHSDLYSVGLIIGEMIVGRKLVDRETIYDTLLFQASDKPVEIPAPVANSPFGSVVERAVCKTVSRRFETAEEMLAALEGRDATTESIEVPAGGPSQDQRSPEDADGRNAPDDSSRAGAGRDEPGDEPTTEERDTVGQRPPTSASGASDAREPRSAPAVSPEEASGPRSLMAEVLLGLAIGGAGLTALLGLIIVLF